MKKNSKASQISDLVNNTDFNPKQVGVELTTDHRYTQQQIFNTFLHFAGMLAENYDKNHYDGRNESACRMAKIMIDELKRQDLYYSDKYTYKSELENSFD